MKKTILAGGLVALMATTAAAQEIGATFSRFDDNWLTVLRTGMVEYAGTIDGLSYQQEDATDKIHAVKEIFSQSKAPEAIKTAIESYTSKAFQLLETLHIGDNEKQSLKIFGEELMNRTV